MTRTGLARRLRRHSIIDGCAAAWGAGTSVAVANRAEPREAEAARAPEPKREEPTR